MLRLAMGLDAAWHAPYPPPMYIRLGMGLRLGQRQRRSHRFVPAPPPVDALQSAHLVEVLISIGVIITSRDSDRDRKDPDPDPSPDPNISLTLTLTLTLTITIPLTIIITLHLYTKVASILDSVPAVTA